MCPGKHASISTNPKQVQFRSAPEAEKFTSKIEEVPPPILPFELWIEVFEGLDYAGLKTCARVNKELNAVTKHSRFDAVLYRTGRLRVLERASFFDLEPNPVLSRIFRIDLNKDGIIKAEHYDYKTGIYSAIPNAVLAESVTMPPVAVVFASFRGGYNKDGLRLPFFDSEPTSSSSRNQTGVTVHDVLIDLFNLAQPLRPSWWKSVGCHLKVLSCNATLSSRRIEPGADYDSQDEFENEPFWGEEIKIVKSRGDERCQACEQRTQDVPNPDDESNEDIPPATITSRFGGRVTIVSNEPEFAEQSESYIFLNKKTFADLEEFIRDKFNLTKKNPLFRIDSETGLPNGEHHITAVNWKQFVNVWLSMKEADDVYFTTIPKAVKEQLENK